MRAVFEVYQDEGGEWRWRLRARNGEIVAVGGEGFDSSFNVQRSIETVKDLVVDAEVEERQPEPKPDG